MIGESINACLCVYKQGKREFKCNNYLNISGKNYPFCISDNSEEVIIVPGIIDFTNLIHFVDGDKIENYFGKYLAVDIFLPEWIPFIAEFSGIVLREGNELSHISITCREYNIPCVIKPDIFEK